MTLTDSLPVSGLANQMSILTRVTNERAGAVKMVTDHGVIISYQFTLALSPTHSSLAGVAPRGTSVYRPKNLARTFSRSGLDIGHSPDSVTNNDPGAVNLLISPDKIRQALIVRAVYSNQLNRIFKSVMTPFIPHCTVFHFHFQNCFLRG